ncbi:MAG: nicotinate-nucleotide--dimethylbenzimidazole phosphoribosyltransferase, partial [Rhodobacteraceae bacterium]|nr:nicotinate-nucleotide--dimethylbenzimidazole phosphoribosyltransferase [Paracoccaceae bacterium]
MQQNFFTLSEYNEILKNQPVSDENSFILARKHNSQLTKPEGSLGKLET